MIFGLGEGCPIHGDAHMRECSTCGAEFCARCHPGATVCADCAEDVEDDLDDDLEDGAPKEMGAEDEEVESLLEEADDLPPEDLVDEEEERRY